MAIRTYYYRATAAATLDLAKLLATGAAPVIAAPTTDNPFIAVTVDDAHKTDLDTAMLDLGFTFVVEATVSMTGKVRLITSADSPYTPGDELTLFVDATAAPVVINLPSLATLTPNERQMRVQKTDASANAVTLDPNGVETINNAGTFVLSGQFDAAEILGSSLLGTWSLLLRSLGTSPPGGSLDAAYTIGRTIINDLGPIIIDGDGVTIGGALLVNPNVAAEVFAQIDITWVEGIYTGTLGGINVDYSPAMALINAATISGINLVGAPNTGAGDSIGLVVDSGWDVGFTVASTGQFLDDVATVFGTDSDWTITYDEAADNALEITGAQAAAGTVGTGFTLTGSEAGTGGSALAGGAVALISGKGGDAGGVNTGGAAGTASLTGGLGGNPGTVTEGGGGAGGAANVTGGVGAAASGRAGRAPGIGGAVSLLGGVGGASTLAAGFAVTSSAGGLVAVAGGAGGAGAANDTANAGGLGGAVTVTGGAGGVPAAGAGTDTGGTGGALFLTGGAGATGELGGSGGTLTLTSGAGATGTAGNAGSAGALPITGGAGGNGAGTGGATTGSGAAVTITAGAGGVSNNAASLHATAGTGGASSLIAGKGGAATVNGGEAGHGGAVTITGGAGGAAVAATDAGDGGNVTVTAGAGVLGGSITVDAGTGSTADGSINIGTNASVNTTVSADVDVRIGPAGELTDDGRLNANVAIADGNALYIVSNAGTARYALSDANADSTARLVGFAANGAAIGNAVRLAGVPGTVIAVSSALSTIGGKVYLSETGGAVTETAPTTTGAFVAEIGYTVTTGVGTSSIMFTGIVSLHQNP